MGVIRRNLEPRPIRIEECDEFNYADYDLTESDPESEVLDGKVCLLSSKSQRRKEERESRRLRRFHNAIETDGINVKKNMGARKLRRVENAQLLLALTDKDDIVDDFSDILEHTMTAFDELFNDQEKMAVWNEFIQKDEKEQRKIIESVGKSKHSRWEEEERNGWFVVGGKRTPKKERDDKRKHHPAYSASSCFARLDKRGKRFLGEKSLPWAVIERADRDLRSFFGSNPAGKWARSMTSARDRQCVHVTSQFLMLTSKTIVNGLCGPLIEVTNPRAFFVPPHSELIPYLATRRKSPIEYVSQPQWDPLPDDPPSDPTADSSLNGRPIETSIPDPE